MRNSVCKDRFGFFAASVDAWWFTNTLKFPGMQTRNFWSWWFDRDIWSADRIRTYFRYRTQIFCNFSTRLRFSRGFPLCVQQFGCTGAVMLSWFLSYGRCLMGNWLLSYRLVMFTKYIIQASHHSLLIRAKAGFRIFRLSCHVQG